INSTSAPRIRVNPNMFAPLPHPISIMVFKEGRRWLRAQSISGFVRKWLCRSVVPKIRTSAAETALALTTEAELPMAISPALVVLFQFGQSEGPHPETDRQFDKKRKRRRAYGPE